MRLVLLTIIKRRVSPHNPPFAPWIIPPTIPSQRAIPILPKPRPVRLELVVLERWQYTGPGRFLEGRVEEYEFEHIVKGLP